MMCKGSSYSATPPQKPPQAARAPSTSPLRRRNAGGNSFVQPAGSTMLTGSGGISNDQLTLGKTTLLGGGS